MMKLALTFYLIRNACPHLKCKVFLLNEDGTMRNYIGMTEHSFKTRFADHKQSFEKKKYATKTSLSRYLWKLKESGIKYSIKWSIIQRARAYRGGSRQCNLCLAEKLCILNAHKRFLLNKKSELISSCRH